MVETIAIVDGDIIAYRCAAANETRSIKAIHKVTRQVIECPHRTALKEQIRGTFEIEEFDIIDVQTPEPIKNAFHAMNTSIVSLLKSCGTENCEIYISGDNNFRDSLPLPSRYKSNREGGIRPLQLKECKEFLIKKHGAIRVHGKEADDMLAQRGYEGIKLGNKHIVCTIDKDANSSHSWLYNWNTMDKPKLISGLGEIFMEDKKLKGYGRKWYYAQWCLGDVTDCFKPSEISGKKFGDVACYKLLNECKTDKDCVQAVYNQYKSWYGTSLITYTAWNGKKYTKSVVELMDLYAACCHMQRFENDIFDTKKLLEKLEIEL